MRSLFLLLLATLMLVGSLWFFHRSGELLASRDYLAGLIHIFVGFATVRAGVELARLSVSIQSRSS